MVTKLDPAKRLALMDKLLPALREEHEKIGALLNELEAVTGGAATVGEKLKELETHWGELWEWRYKEPYAWTDYADSRARWKRIMKKLPFAVLKARVANYLHNGETYFVERRHPFAMFEATINQHVSPREDQLSETPAGCKHKPACRDQFEHTRKRQAEQTT